MKKLTRTPRTRLLALSILTLANPVLAQDQTHNFNIAPQNVNDALKSLANETRLQIFSDGEALRGKQSSGLKGNFTAREALQKLLAGTGLTYSYTAEGAVAVKEAPGESVSKADPTTLPAVKVSGKAVYAEDNAKNHSDENDPYNTSYTHKNANSATKTDTSIMETPINIQVVPRAVIQDQQSVQVGDAIKNVSGVFQGNTYGGFAEEFMIRGFNTNFSNYYDGFRVNV